ncbi:MAG: sugar phosphate isomerase/epimerase [Oscillospiraceae bacterium]|nr:sugar phosphate isomerase/epimerase [Oscillospiraceae bacterium]MDD4369240.1 sugar phosphate isomerase/epimerase [Oscillospiraceae bacterium]
MYVGFLTACLPKTPLDEKIEWAAKHGIKALEVACWPRENDRDYSSSDIDVANLTQAEADDIMAKFNANGLKLSSLGYYDNNLDHDPVRRAFVNRHTKKCIDAAAMLGVNLVGTFVGRNIDKSIKDNFDDMELVFTDLLQYAESRGVRLMIENCPMEGWQLPGQPGTISFTPELWEEMFRRVPSKSFGLNFDPSHLYFQLIDYIPLISQFKDRIFHVHAKDAEIFEDRLHYYGAFNAQLTRDGYWRFRMPGLGKVDFPAMIKALKAIGYDGVISIEHEDPLYEGTDAKVYEGLELGRDYLNKVLKDAGCLD